MLNHCSLKPVWLPDCQTSKLVVSTQFQTQFSSDVVSVNGSVFHLQYEDDAAQGHLGFSTHNKLFLFKMEDPPSECELCSYHTKDEDKLKEATFFLYLHSRPNQATRSFSHPTLQKQFRKIFEQTYLNHDQNMEFKLGRFLFDVRVQLPENAQTYGYISPETVLKFYPECHQSFQIKGFESSDEDTNEVEENPQTSVYTTYKQKLHQIKAGGLGEQLDLIARTVFASRSFKADFIEKIGIKHAKGVLLYGPPGTGKTLLARQLSKVLDAQYQIINGPEIMSKYFGDGEKKLREYFEPAIKQWKEKRYESSLHVIIFDQIDSITKKRGASDSAYTDSLVNQLLTLIDGVDSPNNILVIGMTNRKDLIDDALLRAGRLQVHVEIFLPNLQGRQEIFNIHLKSLRKEGLVSEDVDTAKLSRVMKNYTGAEIELLVRAAWSIAAEQNEKKGRPQEQMKITFEHFLQARNDVSPQFGQDQKEIENLLPSQPIDFQRFMPGLKNKIAKWCKKSHNLKQGKLGLLIKGPGGSGKSSLAASCCRLLDIPFTKFVNLEKIYKLNENQKAEYLAQVFQDSKKCDQSCLILDDLLRLIEYVPLSSKYSNILLQRIQHIIKSSPAKGKKQILIATSDSLQVLDELGLSNLFRTCVEIEPLNKEQASELLKQNGVSAQQLEDWEQERKQFTIKDLIEIIQQS